MARDEKRIREYEQLWRKMHDIPAGAPSTLFTDCDIGYIPEHIDFDGVPKEVAVTDTRG